METKTTGELLKIVDRAYERYAWLAEIKLLRDFEEAIIELTKREERSQ